MLLGFHSVRDLGSLSPRERLSTGKSKELDAHHSPASAAKLSLFQNICENLLWLIFLIS